MIRKNLICWLTVIFLGAVVSLSAAPVVTNVFAGSMQSFLVFSDGSLWAAGNNSYGELGLGTFNYPIYRFTKVFSSNAVAVVTYDNHSLFVDSDGALGAAGDDSYGNLGDGGANPVNKFEGVQVVPTGVISIAVGSEHSMFVKKDGSLWGMGLNSSAQLGDTTENNTNKPEMIVRNQVAQVACGSAATFFVKTNGSVWGTGLLNKFRYDYNVFTPNVVLASGANAIACGSQHVLILKTNGALLAFGANAAGQLGDGTTNSTTSIEQVVSNGVVAVVCNASHSHFIKTDGSLWAMGLNDHGELGDGTTNNILTPKEIVSNSVVAVAAGTAHCLFVKTDGSVWGCGYDGLGNFGDGFTNAAVLTPQQIFPVVAPTLGATASGGSNLQFSAACSLGGTYYVLAGSDLTQPRSQWARVATNTVYDRFNNVFLTTLTNAFNGESSQKFYMLQSP